MVSEGSYAKILEDDWKCYCLIRNNIMEIEGKDIQQDNSLETFVPGNLSPLHTLKLLSLKETQSTSSTEDLSSNFSGEKGESSMWSRGDIVWAKIHKWPGMVDKPDDCGFDTVEENKVLVAWFSRLENSKMESRDYLILSSILLIKVFRDWCLSKMDFMKQV
ncbi:hypothetical protein CDAR_465181 [Caerostris darwini]|uniref:Uncharacterized protein n=1 Tax=Caerostris darwini TaxID=1538125 RepID=A0AAV4V244_9ARAC|nr:hypothetical protein CDAR_465181 [Caerostris darwini]